MSSGRPGSSEIFGKTSCTVKNVEIAAAVQASGPVAVVPTFDFEASKPASVVKPTGSANLCLIAFFVSLVLSGAAAGFVYMLSSKSCLGKESCNALYTGTYSCASPANITHFGRSQNRQVRFNTSDLPYPLNCTYEDAQGTACAAETTFDMYSVFMAGTNVSIPYQFGCTCVPDSNSTYNLTEAIDYAVLRQVLVERAVDDNVIDLHDYGRWYDSVIKTRPSLEYTSLSDYYCTFYLDCGVISESDFLSFF